MRSRTSTAIFVLALAMFVGIAALWFLGGVGQIAPDAANHEAPARISGERTRTDRGQARIGPPARERSRAPDPEARAALRRDIVRALQRRGVPVDVDAATPRTRDDAEPPTKAGSMVDRIGNRTRLLERMNEDFMPLADECIEQARERTPDLRGLVAIDVTLLAERDVGAIVEDANPSSINEVTEPELLECLQQTLLSMSLPGDAVDGLDAVMISLRTDPGEPAAR